MTIALLGNQMTVAELFANYEITSVLTAIKEGQVTAVDGSSISVDAIMAYAPENIRALHEASKAQVLQERDVIECQYQRLSDLPLDHLSEEDYNLAEELLDEIQQLEAVMEQQSLSGYVITKEQVAEHKELVDEFIKVTGEHPTRVKWGAKKLDMVKFKALTGEAENRILRGIDIAEETSCNLVDGAVVLGKKALDATGELTKGAIGLSATGLRGVVRIVFSFIK